MHAILESIARETDSVPRPHVNHEKGLWLAHSVRRSRAVDVLEIGTGRGVSTAYLAAGLTNCGGRVLSIDRSDVMWARPTAEELLARLGLSARTEIERGHTCCTWSLWELAAEERRFDAVFVDGPKWFPTILAAVTLALPMIRAGGWIALDDLGWTYDQVKEPHHFGVEIRGLSDFQRKVGGVDLVRTVLDGRADLIQAPDVPAGMLAYRIVGNSPHRRGP